MMGLTWVNLGDFEDGISTGHEWYNRREISGEPGGQRIGWSTNIGNENLVSADAANEKWQRARHSLSEIPLVGGKKQVRFRFALGSDVGANASGIAIDNFTIRERDRVLLLEEFSTEVRDDAFSVHQQNTDLVLGAGDFNINGMDAVRITYGLSFDEKYRISSDEITARQSHYSIAETPFTLLQGGNRYPGFEDVPQLSDTEISLHSLLPIECFFVY